MNTEYNDCKSILVTGGAGFIGSHLVDYILENYNPEFLVVVDSLTYCSNRDNINPRVCFECVDITEEKVIMNILIKYRIDGILHLAAESDVTRSYQDPYLFLESNVKGTLVLLECMRKINHPTVHLIEAQPETLTTNTNNTSIGTGTVIIGGNLRNNSIRVKTNELNKKEHRIKKFLQCSTDEVYGTAYESEHKENETIFNPTNPYSASKGAAELFCMSYIHSYRLPIVISRMNNVMGNRQYEEKVIPRFVKRLSQGLLPQIQGSGNQKRTFLHTRDASEGLFTVFREGRVGEIYNIGAHKEITIRELAERVVSIVNEYAVTNFELKFDVIENRPFNDLSYNMSTEKIENELNWHPKVDLDSGLEEVVIELYKKYCQ